MVWAHLGLALCNPGDIALVPDPGYPVYAAGLALAGVEPYYMPLRQGIIFCRTLRRFQRCVDQGENHAAQLSEQPGFCVVDDLSSRRLLRLPRAWRSYR